MTVAQHMTANPITVHPETPVYEAQNLMRRERIHRFPVVDRERRLKGIVTEKDLLYASPSPASTLDVYEMSYLLSKLTVGEVMSHNLVTVAEDTVIEEAARLMVDHDIGGLPVLRAGDLVGIITESDIFKIFIEMFGSRLPGLRATLSVPEKPGEMAALTTAIAAKGGNLISIGTFTGEGEPGQGLLTLKVEGLSRPDFETAVAPLVTRILDLRTV